VILLFCIVNHFSYHGSLPRLNEFHDQTETETKSDDNDRSPEGTAMSMLSRANILRQENAKVGLALLPEADPREHYSVSKFQLSPGRSAGFDIVFVNGVNTSQTLTLNNGDVVGDFGFNGDVDGNGLCVKRFICQMHTNRAKQHLAHFAQSVFPCFSALNQAMQMMGSTSATLVKLQLHIFNEKNYMDYMDTILRKNGWNNDLLDAFSKAGIEHITLNEDDKKKSEYSSECDWILNIDNLAGFEEVSGWSPSRQVMDPQDGRNINATITMKRYSLKNAKYFASQGDMEMVQRLVLGEKFQRGPSQATPVRVLILDRADKSRHWLYSKQVKHQLESLWGVDRQGQGVQVKIVHNPNGRIYKQANMFHNSDIIISSHGAQLTNLAFIRPCTAVVELFPFGYYLGFFQSYVLMADGISFDAYPFDASRLTDTEPSVNNNIVAKMRRSGPLQASPESIVHAFPTVLVEMLTCRESWRGNVS